MCGHWLVQLQSQLAGYVSYYAAPNAYPVNKSVEDEVDIKTNGKEKVGISEKFPDALHTLDKALCSFGECMRTIQSITAPDGRRGCTNFAERKALTFVGAPRTWELLHSLENTMAELRIAGTQRRYG